MTKEIILAKTMLSTAQHSLPIWPLLLRFGKQRFGELVSHNNLANHVVVRWLLFLWVFVTRDPSFLPIGFVIRIS